MADEIQRADFGAQNLGLGILDVPDAHAVCGHSQRVMVGGDGDTADDAQILQGGQAIDDLGLGQAKPGGDMGVRRLDQRQAGLGRGNQAAVDVIGMVHACTRKPMKNSLSLGKRQTRSPVSASIRAAVLPMPSGVGVASTNHMFNSWSRA